MSSSRASRDAVMIMAEIQSKEDMIRKRWLQIAVPVAHKDVLSLGRHDSAMKRSIAQGRQLFDPKAVPYSTTHNSAAL